MATIVNTPGTNESSNNGMGFFLGILALIIFLAIFIFYGLPALQRAGNQTAPSIDVPDQIDVNVNPGTGTDNGSPDRQ